MFYNIAKIILAPFFKFLYRIKIEGLENLPENKAFIICGNHLSALDPFLIAVSIPRKITFMAKNELFRNMFLRFLLNSLDMIPIKRGEADIRSIKLSLKALNSGNILGIFPEGTRNITGEVKAEPGVSMLAIKSKVPVVPVAIISNYKFFKRTTIRIGKPREFAEFYDTKLNNEDYKKLSLSLMYEVSNLIKGDII